MVIAQSRIHAEGRKKKMKFDFAEVKEIMEGNPNTVLIVKVENVYEHLFLLHGFNIADDDDNDDFIYEYPCYIYIRKSGIRNGYYRTFAENDLYSSMEKDVFGNVIIRRRITNDIDTPKEILLKTINEYKSQNGYAACVVADDGEQYLAIDDNTLVGDYGRINIENDLDDDLKFKIVGRIVKIFTANIIALDNWVGQNTVWEYDEKDDEFARYCNEHNITPEDLVKYFDMKIDK